MTGSIVLLVAARALVLLDDVPVVLVERVARGETELLMVAHLEAVEIEGGVAFENERRFLQPQEIVCGLLVDSGRVRVCPLGKLDFGARDTEKAQRVAVGNG